MKCSSVSILLLLTSTAAGAEAAILYSGPTEITFDVPEDALFKQIIHRLTFDSDSDPGNSTKLPVRIVGREGMEFRFPENVTDIVVESTGGGGKPDEISLNDTSEKLLLFFNQMDLVISLGKEGSSVIFELDDENVQVEFRTNFLSGKPRLDILLGFILGLCLMTVSSLFYTLRYKRVIRERMEHIIMIKVAEQHLALLEESKVENNPATNEPAPVHQPSPAPLPPLKQKRKTDTEIVDDKGIIQASTNSERKSVSSTAAVLGTGRTPRRVAHREVLPNLKQPQPQELGQPEPFIANLNDRVPTHNSRESASTATTRWRRSMRAVTRVSSLFSRSSRNTTERNQLEEVNI